MKLLNLDEISPVVRQVEIGGKIYDVAQATVGQMLEAAKFSELESDDPAATFKLMVRTAQQILPDAPESVIHRFNVHQLRALIEWANTSDDEVVADSEGGEGKKQ